MLALRTEERKPRPQHSLASAQINGPGCCSSLHCSPSGPPSVQRLSPKHPALGHHLLLKRVTGPSTWTQTGLLRLRHVTPLRPWFPGQGQVFPPS